MHTPPTDLPEPVLVAAIEAGWSLRAAAVAYRAVGFGSHHWDLTDTHGVRWFVTVDDLRTRRLGTGEPLPAGFTRLRASLAAAQALRGAGHDFVVAPLPARNGESLIPLGDFFTVAVYPFVSGESFDGDTFTPQHRRAILDLLFAVHSAPAPVRACALIDDYVIPFRDEIDLTLSDSTDPALGPYARPAAELLSAHASEIRSSLDGYDALVTAARNDPPALVLTHGEPHPGNTMRTGAGWLLIDWDTALLAPPERDLWDLDPGDGSLHVVYTATTGTALQPDLFQLYRVRWDLSEIAVCLARFRETHGDTADDQESWNILKELVPATRGRPGPG